MKNIFVFVFVLTVLNCCHSSELPSGFKKCDKRKLDFNNCLSKSIQSAIEQLKKPIPEYGLPQLEPFLLPEKGNCDFGTEIMSSRQKYTNFRLSGLTNIVNTNATFDFKCNVLTLDLFYNQIVIDYDYELVGRVILLPVNISTRAGVTLFKAVLKLTFWLEEYKNQDQQYFKVTSATLKMTAENMKLSYKNLFKNKRLNNIISDEFDKNWQDILEYWQKVSPTGYSESFKDIFNNLLEKVPIRNLIDG